MLGIDAALEEGSPGEFSVLVDGRPVAGKVFGLFLPSRRRVVEAVRAALSRGSVSGT